MPITVRNRDTTLHLGDMYSVIISTLNVNRADALSRGVTQGTSRRHLRLGPSRGC